MPAERACDSLPACGTGFIVRASRPTTSGKNHAPMRDTSGQMSHPCPRETEWVVC